MSNEYDRINAFVDRLLKDARSPRYRPRPEERQIIRVAILLRAARPCSELPDPRFLERLSRRLRSEFGDVAGTRPGLRGGESLVLEQSPPPQRLSAPR